jgi:hypothetical protein
LAAMPRFWIALPECDTVTAKPNVPNEERLLRRQSQPAEQGEQFWYTCR